MITFKTVYHDYKGKRYELRLKIDSNAIFKDAAASAVKNKSKRTVYAKGGVVVEAVEIPKP